MANFKIFSYAKLSVSSRHIRVLGQFQINKKITSKQTQQTQQQTFPSFPHNLHFFPTAKPNATYIFVLILANDELFEFCVSCGEFGGNMKVFVEFVLRLIFVDLGWLRTLICLLLWSSSFKLDTQWAGYSAI